MDEYFKSILWSQFGASIDMLEHAMRACPDALWTGSRFWHIAYHTIFYLDLALSGPAENFAPPAPFTLSELDPSGVFPDRPYTKDELQTYLDHGRKKCRAVIETLTEDTVRERRRYGSIELPFAELILYMMRHVQHHAGQLNFILGQQTSSAPRWVKRAQG
jgi:uncharacterized damage-inducible protein DinB